MKKILAMVLAMMLVLSMSAAFAETYEDAETITVTASYVLAEDAEDAGIVSADRAPVTFAYDVEGVDVTDSQSTTIPEIEDFEIEFAPGNETNTATITLPEYDFVGVYTYSITQSQKTTVQGVVEDDTPYAYLKVVVIEQDGEMVRLVTLHVNDEDGDKIGSGEVENDLSFENEYKAGALEVSKEVKGLMGEKTREFEITISFESTNLVTSTVDYTTTKGVTGTLEWVNNKATAIVKLAHDEKVVFENLPAGVSYEVVETDATIADDGYETPFYDGKEEGTIANGVTSETVVTNEKGADDIIDTGIILDNAPYMILMALVVIAGAALIVKRASQR